VDGEDQARASGGPGGETSFLGTSFRRPTGQRAGTELNADDLRPTVAPGNPDHSRAPDRREGLMMNAVVETITGAIADVSLTRTRRESPVASLTTCRV
jgi:hypothetical protein